MNPNLIGENISIKAEDDKSLLSYKNTKPYIN